MKSPCYVTNVYVARQSINNAEQRQIIKSYPLIDFQGLLPNGQVRVDNAAKSRAPTLRHKIFGFVKNRRTASQLPSIPIIYIADCEKSMDSNTINVDISKLDKSERINFLSDLMLANSFSRGGFGLGTRLKGISDRNYCCNFSNFEERNDSHKNALEAARELVKQSDNGEAAILFLEGKTGTGKTHLALALAKQYILKGKKVYYLHVAESGDLSSAIDQDKLRTADLVVLDGLASCKGIETSVKEVFKVCHDTSKKLVISSRINPEAIKDQLFPDDEVDKRKAWAKERVDSFTHQKL